MIDLSEAKRLVEAATPGAWDTGAPFEENYLYAGQSHLACMASSDNSDHYLGDDSEAVANARFIVWAKNNLPTLISNHEALTAIVRELADELEASVKREYRHRTFPAAQAGYDADMDVVVRARAMVGEVEPGSA